MLQVFLSGKGFIHRDLAARNVVLDYLKTAKIADFGLCRSGPVGAVYTSKGGRLPVKWMAIESLKANEFTSMSDVWSYAVILYEIYTFGGVPFPTVQPADMIHHLESGHRMDKPDHCPQPVYEIMKLCWQEDPFQRPTFQEISDQLSSLLQCSTE